MTSNKTNVASRNPSDFRSQMLTSNKTDNQKPVGFTAAILPLPDKTYRKYKIIGGKPGHRFNSIMQLWKTDCDMARQKLLPAIL